MNADTHAHRRALAALPAALLLLSFASSPSPSAAGPLKVVTTIPDLADAAREIGGPRVEVRSLSKGTENLHAVPVKPSMIVALSRADLFVQMGLSLECSWVPELLRAARNKRVQPGAAGFASCSEGWEAIEVPVELTRREGDLHPEGNPHFNIDPRAGRHVALRVFEALVRVDPQGRELYEERRDAYLERLEAAEARWKALGRRLAGRKIAVYHLEYNYLALYHGMDVAISIEPKPGIPPTAADVARTVRTMKEKGVEVIVSARWSNNRTVRSIAEKTGARVLELPNQVGGASWAGSWIAMMDGIHERLLEAYGLPLEPPEEDR